MTRETSNQDYGETTDEPLRDAPRRRSATGREYTASGAPTEATYAARGLVAVKVRVPIAVRGALVRGARKAGCTVGDYVCILAKRAVGTCLGCGEALERRSRHHYCAQCQGSGPEF